MFPYPFRVRWFYYSNLPTTSECYSGGGWVGGWILCSDLLTSMALGWNQFADPAFPAGTSVEGVLKGVLVLSFLTG